jgi:hypothetical protein
MPNAKEKLTLALERRWPLAVAAEFFDISEDDAQRLTGEQRPETDRFFLEQKLRHEGRVGLDWLALEFGVMKADLERAMRSPPRGNAPFPLATYASGERYLLPAALASAWVKELLPKHKIWSSLDARARDLAAAIGGEVRPCAVSSRFRESPAACATCRCIATWDDVSRAHQEYLDNGKPLTLEPDHVGWHVIADGSIDPARLMRSDLTNMNRFIQSAA